MSVATPNRRRHYSLRERHWEAARQRLLFDGKLPVLPLVTFLYRDYSLQLPSPPKLADAIAVFRAEFGYEGEGTREYTHLFTDEGVRAKSTSYLTRA